MAKSRKKKSGKPLVIRIERHIAGPPRRAPGQHLVLTPEQIRQQKLGKGDFRVIRTA